MDKTTETNNLNTTQKLRFFSSTGQSYEFTANSKENFSSIYDNFNKSYNFNNSNKKPIALCNGENVQFDKNLEQNNIKNDSSVVLVIQDENESEFMQNQLMQQKMSQQNMQQINDEYDGKSNFSATSSNGKNVKFKLWKSKATRN